MAHRILCGSLKLIIWSFLLSKNIPEYSYVQLSTYFEIKFFAKDLRAVEGNQVKNLIIEQK